ncbi:MAG: hypothetical protein AAF682_29545 [Planctomycetota bacterium]
MYPFDLDEDEPIRNFPSEALLSEPDGVFLPRVDGTGAVLVPLVASAGVVAPTTGAGIRVTALPVLDVPAPEWLTTGYGYKKRFAGWAYPLHQADAVVIEDGNEIAVGAGEDLVLLACYRWDAEPLGEWVAIEDPGLPDLALDELLLDYRERLRAFEELMLERALRRLWPEAVEPSRPPR